MTHSLILETNNHEMELLVFLLDGTYFGINTAKIKEITPNITITPVANKQTTALSSFVFKNETLPLINLKTYLDTTIPQGDSATNGLIIIMQYNKYHFGITVDTIDRIHRMPWHQIKTAPDYLSHLKIPMTGVTRVDDKLVLIADFETICSDVLDLKNNRCTKVAISEKDINFNADILFVDDSSLVRKAMLNNLNKSGFNHITVCCDGQDAWHVINARSHNNKRNFDIVISDIEMPGMNGIDLTDKIKENTSTKETPVILISSISSKVTQEKGRRVGANAQLLKSDARGMINTVSELLVKSKIA